MSRKTSFPSLRLAGWSLLLALAWPVQAGQWDLGDSAIAQLESFHEGLAAFKMNGRWGYVDLDGKLVVEPQFDEVRAFSEGLAAVSRDEKWGFIDRTGKLRIPLGYTYVDDFHQGLAGARLEQGKFGYLAPDGQWAVPPRFERGNDFRQGHALVEEAVNHYRLIDVRGNVVKDFPPEYQISDDQAGLLIVTRQARPVQVTRDGQISPLVEDAGKKSAELQVLSEVIDDRLLYGAKDGAGNWVIAPSFEHMGEFRGGLAIAGSDTARGLIDTAGKFVVPALYKGIEEIPGGRYLAHGENPVRQEVFDRQGRRLFASACARLEQKQLGPWRIFEACDAVWVLNGETQLHRFDPKQPEIARVGDYLLIQSTVGKLVDGRLMTPFTLLGPQGVVLSSAMPEIGGNYDWAMLIDGNERATADAAQALPLALLVARDGGVAIVTHDHRVVRQPAWRYDEALLDYAPPAGNLNGPMVMKTASAWGAVDALGEWVLQAIFEKLRPFSGQIALATLAGQEVIYGRSGRHRELPAGYRLVASPEGERFILEGKNEAGEKQRIEYDLATGEERSYAIDRRFDADEARGGLLPVYEDGKYGLIDSEGKWIAPPVYESRPEALMWNSQLLGWKIYIYENNEAAGGQSLYGLLSPGGQEIVKPRYAAITLHEQSGLLEITDRHTGQQGLMRADGREILPAEYRSIAYRDDGTFQVEPEQLKGLMNMQGEWLLEPGRYDFNGFGGSPYSHERVGDEEAFIDTAGRISTPSRPLAALDDNPDYWERREEQGKSGAVSVFYGFDWKPRLRLPERISEDFSGGVLAYREYLKGRSRLRLVDGQGKMLTLNYDSVGKMSEGLAVAGKGARNAGARYGYIDRQGRTRIAPIYEKAEDFSEGRAVVVLKGNYGIIDTQGKLILHSAWLCGQYPVLIDAQEKVLWPATSLSDCNRPAVKH